MQGFAGNCTNLSNCWVTGLRTSYRKGFSLSTSTTFIDLHPLGDKAAALRAWGQANMDMLAAKNHQVFEARHSENQHNLLSIKQLLKKKVGDTLQEEHHWLHVELNELDCTKLHLYLGCSNCGTCNSEELGAVYTCTQCFKENVVSSPRMTLTFEAKDESGSYFLSALTENAEILLEVDATTLYSMFPKERENYLLQIERQLRSAPVYIQVVPSASLSKYRKLYWVLKKVSLN